MLTGQQSSRVRLFRDGCRRRFSDNWRVWTIPEAGSCHYCADSGRFICQFYLGFLVRGQACVNTAAKEEECIYVACSRRITIKIIIPIYVRTPLGGRKYAAECTRVLCNCLYGTFPCCLNHLTQSCFFAVCANTESHSSYLHPLVDTWARTHWVRPFVCIHKPIQNNAIQNQGASGVKSEMI